MQWDRPKPELSSAASWNAPNRVEDLPNGIGGIVDGLERLKKDQVSGVKLIAHPQDAS
ncbi:hypothetical protein K435DRAFT_881551 [Dendrothele bispora CBS 962.96]|uniref:Uncharacterized protein n=1 Tax=Dendrothele bispora (strain CBS 962.96) TaxID=1314807 RepID=A0A4S8KIE1_DENBC|nr:hypothetical protein K435DRAFT_881551 [Dendrothele bispora CBS 962.96]